MFRTATALLAFLSIVYASGARADGGFEVKLPTLPEMDEAAALELYTALDRALVYGQNCPGYQITQGEWELVSGTQDIVSGRLGLDIQTMDDMMHVVFDEMDADPSSCAREVPKVQSTVRMLIGFGGGTDPI